MVLDTVQIPDCPIMHNYSHLTATRWAIDCATISEAGIESPIGPISQPHTWEYVTILQEATRLHMIATQAIGATNELIAGDVERYHNSPGRAVSIRVPVQFTPGIGDLAILINGTLPEIESILQEIEDTADQATFSSSDPYQLLARRSITLSRTLQERTELYLYSHLWLMWAIESLTQCRQMKEVVIDSDQYNHAEAGIFPYIAHPPMMVTTLACTAVIESVGAYYLNKYTDRSISPDKKSSSVILEGLAAEYEPASVFEIEAITATVVEARHDLVHYSRDRHHQFTLERFDRYRDLVWQTIALNRILLTEIMNDVLQNFTHDIIDSAPT